VGLRTGPDDVKKRKIFTLPGLELRPLCRPARTDYDIPAQLHVACVAVRARRYNVPCNIQVENVKLWKVYV
jgi:hypothetical protein